MKLLLNSLIHASLLAFSSWSVSSTGTLVVTQTPDVSVMEGETVNITCYWTGMLERVERVGVNWLKNQTEIKKKTGIISTNTSQGSLWNEACNCSTFTISSITREDAGTYYCKVTVEVPFLNVVKGNGTIITVQTRERTDENTHGNTAGGVSSTGTLVVTQTPDVSVMEGETVNIYCYWTGFERVERMRVNWLKNQTEIKKKTHVISTKTSQGSLQKEACNCSTFTISSITREDAGTYYCKVNVEIPFLNVVKGNGTIITVQTRQSTDENTHDNTKDNTAGGSQREEVLIYFLRCLPILALVATFFYLNSSGTKTKQHTPASLENTPVSAHRRDEDEEEEGNETEIEAER